MNRASPGSSFPVQQRGTALAIVLIFLTVLSLTGASASLNAAMQERMASGLRNRDVALQAAEAALRDAAASAATWRALAFDGTQSGLGTVDPAVANDVGYWRDPQRWASSRAMTDPVERLAEPPRVRIDRIGVIGSAEHFRVTVRAVGGSADALVVLQAVLALPIAGSPGSSVPTRVGWQQIV